MSNMPNTIRNQDLATIESIVFNPAGERGYGLCRQLPESLPDQALYDENDIKIGTMINNSFYRDAGEDFCKNPTFRYAASRLYATRPELAKFRSELPSELQWDESGLPKSLPYYTDHLVRLT